MERGEIRDGFTASDTLRAPCRMNKYTPSRGKIRFKLRRHEIVKKT